MSLRDSDHWQIALQITDPSSRQRRRPKTKSKAIFRQKKGNSNIWSWAPKGCPTPRHTDSLTVSRKVTSTSVATGSSVKMIDPNFTKRKSQDCVEPRLHKCCTYKKKYEARNMQQAALYFLLAEDSAPKRRRTTQHCQTGDDSRVSLLLCGSTQSATHVWWRNFYTGCFKTSVTNLKAYINLFRVLELS
jgi:hypothetical protein